MATAPTYLPKLGATEGATFLGGLGTAMLYGCTNVQIYLYFSNYRQDGFRMKFTVILLWIMDSLHMALTVVALWHYLIDSFGDYSALLAETWMVKLQSIVHIFGVLIVQTLYTARVWKLSLSLDHKVWPRTISMILVAGYGKLLSELYACRVRSPSLFSLRNPSFSRVISLKFVFANRTIQLGNLLIAFRVHVPRLHDSDCGMSFVIYLQDKYSRGRDEVQGLGYHALRRHFWDFNEYLLAIRLDHGDHLSLPVIAYVNPQAVKSLSLCQTTSFSWDSSSWFQNCMLTVTSPC
ncbi:hypothetical protein F5887DRAFT_1281294 [Amanita rubescens]|nr:hypothetical protein F5887DRAFT_1281294 [Amanita rubescens]